VIPCLYVEGLSTRDFNRALKPLWGSSGLSKSSISRANRALKESFTVWRKRNLSEENILYLFLDGYYLGLRQNSREKEGILVAHGVRKDGSRVLLSIHLGYRESTDSWKTVLYDLKQRGLTRPSLVVIDGSSGLNRALKEVWHDVPFNRCTKHKTANVLSRIPKKRQEEVRRRTNVIGRFPNEMSALSMVFGVLEEDR
jgi:transposase-like protein